jgi:hypothetical protein
MPSSKRWRVILPELLRHAETVQEEQQRALNDLNTGLISDLIEFLNNRWCHKKMSILLIAIIKYCFYVIRFNFWSFANYLIKKNNFITF